MRSNAKLRCLSGKETTTLRSSSAKVKIDDGEFQTKFHVVEAKAIPIMAIVGKELMSDAKLIIKRNVFVLKNAVVNEERATMQVENAKNNGVRDAQ